MNSQSCQIPHIRVVMARIHCLFANNKNHLTAYTRFSVAMAATEMMYTLLRIYHVHMHPERCRFLNAKPIGSGPVVYWMRRDRRVRDNWALFYAAQEAKRRKVPLAIISCINPKTLQTNKISATFMLHGFLELEQACAKINIPFLILLGDPKIEVPAFIKRHTVGLLVTDSSSLSLHQQAQAFIAQTIPISCVEVDAHNIIPCWVLNKTITHATQNRAHPQRLLKKFLDTLPRKIHNIQPWTHPLPQLTRRELEQILAKGALIRGTGLPPHSGETYALRTLRLFINNELKTYQKRNPFSMTDTAHHLYTFLRFGQISAQRIAQEVQKSSAPLQTKRLFMKELLTQSIAE